MLGDAMISAAALLLLFVCLVLIDPRVRVRLAELTRETSASDDAGCLGWQCLGDGIRDVSATAFGAASDQLALHTSLAVFTLAALVLVLFMVRT